MPEGFPKSTRAMRTAEVGVNLVSSLVNNEWGWIFRRNPSEYDFGIDGYIDVVHDDGHVTGQSLAVQIKTGRSFFETEANGAITFYGERKHLNYYLNLQMPVLIVLCDPDTSECFWAQSIAEATESTPTGWKMAVLRSRTLGSQAKATLLEILGPPNDHLDELASHWALNDALAQSEFILYSVDRQSIEAGDTDLVRSFFLRLRSNPTLCRNLQGRVELSIGGYDDDDRELWEVQEVRAWFEAADPAIRDWFFFPVAAQPAHGLKLYAACQCSATWIDEQSKWSGPVNIQLNSQQLAELLDRNWPRLNQLTDELGMTEDDNKAIAFAVMAALGIPSNSQNSDQGGGT